MGDLTKLPTGRKREKRRRSMERRPEKNIAGKRRRGRGAIVPAGLFHAS